MLKRIFVWMRLFVDGFAIHKSLRNIKESINDLDLEIEDVKTSTLFISETDVNFILEKYTKFLKVIEGKTICSLNKSRFKYYSNLNSTEKPRKLLKLENSYKDISLEFRTKVKEFKLEVERINANLEPYYAKKRSFSEELESLKEEYISHSKYLTFKERYEDVYSYFKPNEGVNNKIDTFLSKYEDIKNIKNELNEAFVERELELFSDFFNDIDGKSLDKQQREAVVVDEDANLVVAGAGSGKTLTISAKVKYLVDIKGVSPDDILLLSFTRKAAEEMTERISKNLDIPLEAMTFHKLGLDIIAKFNQLKPDVLEDPTTIFEQYFENSLFDNPMQIKKVIEFIGYYLYIPKDLNEFKSLSDYYDYHKNMDLETIKGKYGVRKYNKNAMSRQAKHRKTIKGEVVKSLEEVIIANFLFLNGINYLYEDTYKYPTGDQYHRVYKPDFYLPDYDIYIEHFGITRNNTTPWLSRIEQEKYINSMNWKRNLHKQKGTTLLETYSYLNREGTLLKTLEDQLLEHGVRFKEIDLLEIFHNLYDGENKNHFHGLSQLVSTFINLFKSNGYTLEDFEKLNKNSSIDNLFLINRKKLLLKIIKPAYKFYEESLKKMGKIDFNDMINKASKMVGVNTLRLKYKYIIVDEYQDISVSRNNLIKAIKKVTKAKLMCVGDDWQSIYRFAGSDISLFTKFKKHFGYSSLLRIEKTYRNSQELIDIAGGFIMKNEDQIDKRLVSSRSVSNPIVLCNSFTGAIEEIVKEHGEDSEVMLIARSNYKIERLQEYINKSGYAGGRIKLRRTEGETKVIYTKYPHLKMYFLSAHRSKGLEAENVILINTGKGPVGFPNIRVDDPILSLVMSEQDHFDFAEERRVFYVALTRTLNKTYIISEPNHHTMFVKELVNDYDVSTTDPDDKKGNIKCPRCKGGILSERTNNNDHSTFLGCSYYPKCDYTYPNTSLLDNKIVCGVCDGYMVLRKGYNGEFYGCTNYPTCTNTKEKNSLYNKSSLSDELLF